MTYWKAIKLLRAKNLSAAEKINRNLTIAAGNVMFAVLCLIASIVLRAVFLLRGH